MPVCPTSASLNIHKSTLGYFPAYLIICISTLGYFPACVLLYMGALRGKSGVGPGGVQLMQGGEGGKSGEELPCTAQLISHIHFVIN
jgi:hypothetical protein